MVELDSRTARLWSIMGINPVVWSVGLADVLSRCEDIAILTADLARYSGLQRTFEAYPDKCYNVGIAEQNMVGIGAGMAMRGLQVWMTTYAPFMSMRCADQVRHLMGNLSLNIKAVGSAAGLSAGLSGASLLAVNDTALMRSIPGMTIVQPADCAEAVKAVLALSELEGPAYIRFCGATRVPIVYQADYGFVIGKGVVLKEGTGIALVATGTDIVARALEAADVIEQRYEARLTVVDMHTIKPIDQELLGSLAQTHDLIVTVEEHSVIGGLGSAVAECLVEGGFSCRQLRMGISDSLPTMGSRPFMLEQAGLTVEHIADICRDWMMGRKARDA